MSLKDILILSFTTPNLTSAFVSLIQSWVGYLALPRDYHVIWSLSLQKALVVQNTASTQEAVTWSLLSTTYMWYIHSAVNKIEVKNYPLTWPLSTYNSLFVLFPVTSDCRSLWLSLFQNNSHATSTILCNYSLLISLVFVPCPFSLPIYKITHYILALKRNYLMNIYSDS